jgi:hypothetical protein
MHKNEQETKQKLMEFIREVLAKDQALRDQYGVGEKFRFIREKLQAVLTYVENEITVTSDAASMQPEVQENEQVVYVYLFNSQGVALSSWRKMVHESVLYEYSINRPIYSEKSQIDALIRSRPNKLQHAYLSIIIKKPDILEQKTTKDAIGNTVLKIKEGSLKRNKILSFTHAGHDYLINSEGEFVVL